MNKEYFDVIMKGKPIPGSSLTSDPNNPAPYETPPDYVNIHEASEWIFSKLIEETNYEQLLQALSEDMPVMDIAQVILFTGFTEGKWDVNLMMLLVEPTAYMILALAERAGIDPVIFRGEEEEAAEEEVFFGTRLSEERLNNLKKFKELGVQIPYLSEESKNKIDSLPIKEGAGEQEQQEGMEAPEQQPESLLAQPNQEVQQ